MSDIGGPDTDPGEDVAAAPAPAWWGTGAAATQCEGAALAPCYSRDFPQTAFFYGHGTGVASVAAGAT